MHCVDLILMILKTKYLAFNGVSTKKEEGRIANTEVDGVKRVMECELFYAEYNVNTGKSVRRAQKPQTCI